MSIVSSLTCIKILVHTYQNTFKTNEHTVTKKKKYLVVHITTDLNHSENMKHLVGEL